MKLSEFKSRVKELAGGRCHSVGVRVTEYSSGAIEYEWSAYIDGIGWRSADKPESVILGLQGFPVGQKPDDEGLPGMDEPIKRDPNPTTHGQCAKPDWRDAPEWANYLAADRSGGGVR